MLPLPLPLPLSRRLTVIITDKRWSFTMPKEVSSHLDIVKVVTQWITPQIFLSSLISHLFSLPPTLHFPLPSTIHPNSPAYSPTSPAYSPTSPAYSPTRFERHSFLTIKSDVYPIILFGAEHDKKFWGHLNKIKADIRLCIMTLIRFCYLVICLLCHSSSKLRTISDNIVVLYHLDSFHSLNRFHLPFLFSVRPTRLHHRPTVQHPPLTVRHLLHTVQQGTTCHNLYTAVQRYTDLERSWRHPWTHVHHALSHSHM